MSGAGDPREMRGVPERTIEARALGPYICLARQLDSMEKALQELTGKEYRVIRWIDSGLNGAEACQGLVRTPELPLGALCCETTLRAKAI